MDLSWHNVPRCYLCTFLRGNGVSSFTSELKLTPLNNGIHWKLLERFEYHLGIEGSGLVLAVPEDFVTDFASIPRFFWRVLPPWNTHGKAAVLHDWMYQSGTLSRIVSDAIFLEAMGVLGVAKWKRYAMYMVVRMFGWTAYKGGS